MIQHLGVNHAAAWLRDPKHLGFMLARYKFVAKMFAGMPRVLEVGCGDATGYPIVAAAVGYLAAVDKDPDVLGSIEKDGRYDIWTHTCRCDLLEVPFTGPCPDGTLWAIWDGIFALDVLEHIPAEDEDRFLANICASLSPHGSCIIGMPSLESQPYASAKSVAGHVNCKTEDGLRETMKRHFHSVFILGQNDEVLHVGFGPMCHYRYALCAGKIA